MSGRYSYIEKRLYIEEKKRDISSIKLCQSLRGVNKWMRFVIFHDELVLNGTPL
jgi:hypothetical protein